MSPVEPPNPIRNLSDFEMKVYILWMTCTTADLLNALAKVLVEVGPTVSCDFERPGRTVAAMLKMVAQTEEAKLT